MSVTVKTVKKKPLSLKKAGPELAEGAEGAEGVDSAEGQAAGAAPVVMAGRPASGKPSVEVKPASYTFAGVCAILELIMFLAILTLQIVEWKFYLEPKSAFPPFGTLIPIPGGSSVSAVPAAAEEPAAEDAVAEEPVSAEEPAAAGAPAEADAGEPVAPVAEAAPAE